MHKIILPMIYQDRIYGKFEISEPVLVELINSPELERIKGVDQHGYFEQYFPGTAFSRFEHSMGVMLLLRKFGASLEEQISGLIHDVSHTVFSHAADFVFGKQVEQDYQDSNHKKFVRKSSLKRILEKYGYNSEYILEEKNFPLLEKPLPDLCADRIDYSLREMFVYKFFKKGEIDEILSDLESDGKNWYFEGQLIARKFAEGYLKMSNTIWSGPQAAIVFKTLGSILSHSLKKAYLIPSDLYTTDQLVLDKIRAKLDSDLDLKTLYVQLINPQKFELNSNNPDIVTEIKSRAVDPLVKDRRLSEIEPNYKITLEEALMPIHYSIKLLV